MNILDKGLPSHWQSEPHSDPDVSSPLQLHLFLFTLFIQSSCNSWVIFLFHLFFILLVLLLRDFLSLNSHSSVCLIRSSIVCSPFPLLLPVFPFFPFVVSISSSLSVPGDGHLTPGIRSQWMHGSPANAALAALWLASRAVPSLVPVARSLPKGIPTRDNGQLTRVNNSLLHASMPQRHRQRKGKKCKYSTILHDSRKISTLHKAKPDASLSVH